MEVAKKSHDIQLLNALKNFFNKGYLKPKYNITSRDESIKARSISRFILYGDDNIIKFFSE